MEKDILFDTSEQEMNEIAEDLLNPTNESDAPELTLLEAEEVLEEDILKEETLDPVYYESDSHLPPNKRDSRNMLARLAIRSGHQSGYPGSPIKDNVDKSREEERLQESEASVVLNRKFELAGGRWPDENADRPRKPRKKSVGSEVRFLADMLKSTKGVAPDPETIIYPRHIRQMPWKMKSNIIKACTNAKYPGLNWNSKIFSKGIRPSTIGCRNPGSTQIVYDPAAPVQPYLPGIASHPKDNKEILDKTAEWIAKAEKNELPDRITKCVISGDSLILRKKGKLSSWHIGPNINGMGLRGVRMAVEAAAYIAGLDPEIDGVDGAPELVYQLAKDGDAWAILAFHTNDPKWGATAKFLLMLRDTLYFRVDEKEIRDSERIAQKIIENLKKVYPNGY